MVLVPVYIAVADKKPVVGIAVADCISAFGLVAADYFQGEQSLLRHLVVPVAFGDYIELAAVDLGARSSLVYLPPSHKEAA